MNAFLATAPAAADAARDLPPWMVAGGVALVVFIGGWVVLKLLKWLLYFVLAAAVLAGCAGLAWLVLR
jgi:hypothetical protein